MALSTHDENQQRCQDLAANLRRLMAPETAAVFLLNAAGRIDASCDQAPELFNENADDLKGRCIEDLFMESDIDAGCPGPFPTVLNTPTRATGRTGCGRTFALEFEIRLITADGDCRYMALIRPLTSHRRLEYELSRLLFDAACSGAVTDSPAIDNVGNCLALISHEIRTPMTAILGYADLLKDPMLDEDERSACIDTISSNGQYLLTLINDLLDLSKIQSGKLNLEQIDCCPAHIVHEVASFLSVQARESGLDLDITIDPSLPDSIHTDPIRIRQILINLVGNAIKFTEVGRVHVSCRTSPEHHDKVRFEVADSGPGLTEEEIAHIFEPFRQSTQTGGKSSNGTGLGLTICRRLAQLLGGEVSVRSMPGQGSTFTLTLPMASSPSTTPLLKRSLEHEGQHEPNPHVSPLRGRILLAEDTPDTQRLVTTLLERQGMDVECVGDGRAAVEMALHAGRHGRPFDIILMDMQMPVMDGYTATAELRQAGHGGPIIALTANAMADDRRKTIEAGCNECLTKPIHPAQFRDDIRRILESAGRTAPSTDCPEPPQHDAV